MADQPPPACPAAKPADPIDLTSSVAGEEDPGASIDLAATPARSDPTGMRPGDQAPEGTPGTGETVCPRCGGSGKQGASVCPECQGTGKVTAGIGGA